MAQNNRNLFSHTLEARCPKSASLGGYQVVSRTTLPPEALEENPFFASSSFRWLPAFLDSQPVQSLSPWSHCPFLFCFESPSASLLCGHFFLLHLVLTQIQGYAPISRALTISTKIQHLPIPGIKTWYINIWMAHYNHISTFPLSILFYIVCYYKSNRCLLKKIRIYG